MTTISAAPARPRARSEKHSAPYGQRATPRHSRADTLTWDQDRSGTPGLRSSRSPDIGRRRPGGEPLHVTAQSGGRHRVEEFFLRPFVLFVCLAAEPPPWILFRHK